MKALLKHLKHKEDVIILATSVVLLVVLLLVLVKSLGILKQQIEDTVKSNDLITSSEPVSFNLEKIKELGLEEAK